MVSRLILICGLAMYQPAAVLAQSSDTVPEALRRLFESIPAPRLPDSLGFAKAGVIAMDGEGMHKSPSELKMGWPTSAYPKAELGSLKPKRQTG